MADLFGRQLGDAQPEAQAVPGQVLLIVEALLNQIRIERPTGHVLVKGRVERLSAWPKGNPRHLFGELIGSDRSIEFRCPIAQGPKAVGEHVVLSGTLTIRPSPIHQGFAVQLVSEVVGSWTPEQRAAVPVILDRRRGRLPLRHLIAQHGLSSLCLIGSETGLGDARAALLRHCADAPWREVVCKVADAEAVPDCFAQACRDHAVAGIAFVRGGSDPLTLQIWNDRPCCAPSWHSRCRSTRRLATARSCCWPTNTATRASRRHPTSAPRRVGSRPSLPPRPPASSGRGRSWQSSPSAQHAPSRGRFWRVRRRPVGGAGRSS